MSVGSALNLRNFVKGDHGKRHAIAHDARGSSGLCPNLGLAHSDKMMLWTILQITFNIVVK